jgi:hypothetical protein
VSAVIPVSTKRLDANASVAAGRTLPPHASDSAGIRSAAATPRASIPVELEGLNEPAGAVIRSSAIPSQAAASVLEPVAAEALRPW